MMMLHLRIRSLYALTAICFLLASPAFAASDKENLLPNPTFEGELDERGVPPGWRLQEDVEIERMESAGETPSTYIRIHDAPGRTVAFESERIPVRPGSLHKAEVWFRSDVEGQGPRLYIRRYDPRPRGVGLAFSGAELEITETDGEWSKLTAELEAPEVTAPGGHNAWSNTISIQIWSPEERGAPFDIGTVSLTVEPLHPPEHAPVSEGLDPVDIGSRRELFIDDYLIDGITSSLTRRLHHPIFQEVVTEKSEAEEEDTRAHFSLVQDEDRLLIRYHLDPAGEDPSTEVIEIDDGIRPYFRAPHLYLGLANRVVTRPARTPDSHGVIQDGVLLNSRDGQDIDHWGQAFIQPGAGGATNRNPSSAWGMAQSSPEELSLFWVEDDDHPTPRIRHGTLRTDGFVSLHAGGEDFGEMITRPIVFSGNRLEVNYATSAMGAIWFELCDAEGHPIEGFTFHDSFHDHEALYGNEIAHTVGWKGGADVGDLAGQPVRLRIRLHDADLYSFRFTEE